MAKEYYMRTIVAGRYRKIIRYTRALPRDSGVVRARKVARTNSAQKYINIKNSTERLQWLLCANYDHKDACFCTFTFRDSSLPGNRQAVKKQASDLLSRLRKEWGRQNRELKSIYTVEGVSLSDNPLAVQADSIWETIPWKNPARWEQLDDDVEKDKADDPVRFHFHCFLLLRKEDYDVVRAFWPYGHVHINSIKVNDPMSFQRLASYTMKEVRDGKRAKGERAYIPSLNLTQPEMGGHWCSEFEGIVVPPGAEHIRQGGERDEFGSSIEYASYRMPRSKQVPASYKSKGRLDRKRRNKKKA